MSDLAEKNIAAERREARRRRILENADSRLQKITDLPSTNKNVTEELIFSVGERTFAQEATNVRITEAILSEREPIVEASLGSDLSKEWNPMFTSRNQEASVKEPDMMKTFLYSKRIHLVIVAVITYILLSRNAGYLIYENIMVPFYTLEFSQLVLRTREPKSGIASMLITVLGMYGVSSNALSVSADIVALALSMVHDLCLYLFIIIVCVSLFGW